MSAVLESPAARHDARLQRLHRHARPVAIVLLCYAAARVLTTAFLTVAHLLVRADWWPWSGHTQQRSSGGFLQWWDGHAYRLIATEGYPTVLPLPLRAALLAYVLSLVAVFLPQQSLFRLFLPTAPALVMRVCTGSRRRVLVTASVSVALQPVAVMLLWVTFSP